MEESDVFKLLEPAKRICTADGNNWDELEKTYHGRQQQQRYKAFAAAAIHGPHAQPSEPIDWESLRKKFPVDGCAPSPTYVRGYNDCLDDLKSNYELRKKGV